MVATDDVDFLAKKLRDAHVRFVSSRVMRIADSELIVPALAEIFRNPAGIDRPRYKFSRACRSARAIQTSSSRNFPTRPT